ncbi:hypothetical protein NBM05_08535 [Rothia sp. AR01]|uniref:Uncharacterized protein n=1 Tax=Rothia santali TaxID=2949643 RepID=A0A9X2HJI5_9MICC|nr:hypothetical protein [Rothia santali]MCP3426048.1 hypothetical protein [Rothia santali]
MQAQPPEEDYPHPQAGDTLSTPTAERGRVEMGKRQKLSLAIAGFFLLAQFILEIINEVFLDGQMPFYTLPLLVFIMFIAALIAVHYKAKGAVPESNETADGQET